MRLDTEQGEEEKTTRDLKRSRLNARYRVDLDANLIAHFQRRL